MNILSAIRRATGPDPFVTERGLVNMKIGFGTYRAVRPDVVCIRCRPLVTVTPVQVNLTGINTCAVCGSTEQNAGPVEITHSGITTAAGSVGMTGTAVQGEESGEEGSRGGTGSGVHRRGSGVGLGGRAGSRVAADVAGEGEQVA